MNRSLRIFGPRGIVFEQEVELFDRPVRVVHAHTVADSVPISQIMTPHVVCAAPDLPLDELIALMVRERLGCVPIVDEDGHPHGMVTKLDIVTQLVDTTTQPAPVAADVMMPLAISLDQDSTVKNAAALLATEDLHHVMVVADRRLIGIVSTMDITRWLASNDGAMS